MAEGVKGALKFFWTLVDNWKKNKDAELNLSSVNGHLMVKYSMNLGVWVLPTSKSSSDSASRGHLGPRKGVGPSRQRRRERRAAERLATASGQVVRNASEEVAIDLCDKTKTTPQITEEVAENVHKKVAEDVIKDVSTKLVLEANKVRTCKRCGQPTKGHNGPCGIKCTNVLASPESLRHAPEQGVDMLLNLTPVKDIREEDNLLEDSPEHAPKAMEKVEVDEDTSKFKTKEEEQNYSDNFIRNFVLASVVDKFNFEMVCHKCHKKFSKKPEFKTHMKDEHNIGIFIDLKGA